jgi:hypothetical protein
VGRGLSNFKKEYEKKQEEEKQKRQKLIEKIRQMSEEKRKANSGNARDITLE